MENKKKLYRSTSDRVIAGLAGGIAEYFGVDSTIVRLAIVILAVLSGGPMILVYLLAWLIIPKDKELSSSVNAQDKPKARKFIGYVFILLGLFMLIYGTIFYYPYHMMPMYNFYDFTDYRDHGNLILPIVFILIGFWVLARHGRGKDIRDTEQHEHHEPKSKHIASLESSEDTHKTAE